MKTKTRPTRDDYLELVRRFPLRPVRTEAEYDAAIAVVNTLAIRGEDHLTSGQADYLDVLADLVGKYEEEHYRMPTRTGTPLERLRYIVEQAGMSASDLGRLLGNRGLGATLLAGRRELSKTHIRMLADHFKVEPGYFM
ncbi:MAG: type II toxin-antitoxin system HigA family antitoxin [Tepidisphaerales bacterium]